MVCKSVKFVFTPSRSKNLNILTLSVHVRIFVVTLPKILQTKIMLQEARLDKRILPSYNLKRWILKNFKAGLVLGLGQ